MKLDVLYEIDVPKPWGPKAHPYGQREHQQQKYREVLGILPSSKRKRYF